MIITNRLEFKVGKKSCIFKIINNNDVNKNYINGLRSQKSYLISNPDEITIEYQKQYINRIIDSEKDCIFGLWVNGTLIGTSGVQNITKDGIASIGIFIFDKNFRSLGFGKTMVWASCSLLYSHNKIELFSASMFKKNLPSLNSFLSVGFEKTITTHRKITVRLLIDRITKPYVINSIKYYD